MASVRAGFLYSRHGQRDWMGATRASVERAVRLAPELAETHLARATLASQDGDWRGAVLALRAALDAAPTFAAALQYLGNLQCEAGQVDEGMVRLRMAYALDPGMCVALVELCRCSALRGHMEDYRWGLQRLMAQPMLRLQSLTLRVRVAAWMGDMEELRRCYAEARDEPGPVVTNLARYAAAVLGEADPRETLASIDALLDGKVSPRFVSLLCQLTTEQLCLTGHAELALGYFQRAADTALIDLEWTDRCRALVPLRALPGFAEGRRKVRARVEAIWTA
jgi:serine/threonine-protein kinase